MLTKVAPPLLATAGEREGARRPRRAEMPARPVQLGCRAKRLDIDALNRLPDNRRKQTSRRRRASGSIRFTAGSTRADLSRGTSSRRESQERRRARRRHVIMSMEEWRKQERGRDDHR